MGWFFSFLVLVVGSLFGSSHGQTPLPCGRDTIALQTYYMQDVSLSFASQFNNQVQNVMTPVAATLASEFGEVQWALASFSDKPSLPSGYSIDHCYREEHVFSTDAQEFIHQLDSLSVLSGRDWEESQLDSIHYGVNSPDIGWDFRANTEDGRWLMRVVMVATDSGLHVEGDRPSLVGGTDCTGVDYPSLDSVRQLLESRRVYPIVVVPLELKAYYDTLLSSWPNVRVVENSDTYVLPAIYEIADELCATTTAAPTTTTPTTTTPTTTTPTTTTGAPNVDLEAIGCGDSFTITAAADIDCEDHCFNTRVGSCSEVDTNRINTSAADCQRAIEERFGLPASFTFETRPVEGALTVGCNYSSTTSEGILATVTSGPTGCIARAASDPRPEVVRLCCCQG